jgi:orotidine-5'-phosphate decarboxylase
LQEIAFADMKRQQLVQAIRSKRSFLCIGLDTDPEKIPAHFQNFEDPVFEFNRQIIDATHDLAVAYKPNIAFYESLGLKGWGSLVKTIRYLDQYKENVFTIADAKRGDIGNTSEHYAAAFFGHPPKGLGFDSITVAPYMGHDSVKPFLKFENKWAILLVLTSNAGANDFQNKTFENGKMLFEEVLETSKEWGGPDKLMYVVGATKAEMLTRVREIVPDSFLLVPGVGAQGGSLPEVAKFGMNDDCGLLVNSSRGIIYAGKGEDFALKAREQALMLQQQMELELKEHRVI